MRAKEFIDEACWAGYRKDGMKTMFGKRYPNCVKKKKKSESIGEQSVAEGSYTTEKQLLTRIRQIMYDRKLSGTDSNAGELLRLKQQLKDLRSQQGVAEGLGDWIFTKIDNFLDMPKISSDQVSKLMKQSPANLPDDVAEKLVARFMETEKAKRLAQQAAEANQTTVEKIVPYLTFVTREFVDRWNRIPYQDRSNALKNLAHNVGRFLMFVLETLIKGMLKKEGVAEGSQPGQPVVDAILKVMPIAQEIWFHGSRATGKHRRNSDTDILVVVPDDLVGDQYLAVVRILQKLSSHFDNYDIQPTKSETTIHRIAQEEGRLLWSNKQGMAEGNLQELANTSIKVTEPKNFVNTNDRKQVTYKVMKFKSGGDTYLINFTMKGPPAYGKKQNYNVLNVAFGVKEKQDDYSFGDEINTDLTARNKNQFLIYSTVINAVRKFITEYNTEVDEIVMQGAGERQEVMYQRFFRSAGKYFPGWHHDGKHSLVRDVPRQQAKKVKEQGVAEGLTTEKQLLTRIRQIMYDRKLSGTESNAGELLRLKQQLKDLRSQQQMADSLELELETIKEDLRKWFKQKWVRFGPDGKIRGDCARGSSKEGKPKCLPQAKAHALGKKGRATAGARKRREDPNANRSGKAINVKTK